jgi:hypothetical protein
MRWLASLVPSVALLLPIGSATAQVASKSEGEVRKVIAGLAEAWNSHDMKSFAQFCAEDAVRLGGRVRPGAGQEDGVSDSCTDERGQPMANHRCPQLADKWSSPCRNGDPEVTPRCPVCRHQQWGAGRRTGWSGRGTTLDGAEPRRSTGC